jgi:hypothetical protein
MTPHLIYIKKLLGTENKNTKNVYIYIYQSSKYKKCKNMFSIYSKMIDNQAGSGDQAIS